MDPELISRYADGEVTEVERAAVERALREDPETAAYYRELRALDELFGRIEGEPVSADLRARLLALVPAGETRPFEPVRIAGGASAGRRRRDWVAGIAALLLAAVGVARLIEGSPVRVEAITRQRLDGTGAVVATEALGVTTMRAGDRIAAAADERVSFRLEEGASEIVVLPGASIRLGDPDGDAVLDVECGTVLAWLFESPRPRAVRAGGLRVRTDRALFGVRVEPAAVRAAGAACPGGPVAVAVARGAVEVEHDGGADALEDGDHLLLEPGRPPVRSPSWTDPLRRQLKLAFDGLAHEIAPGYFDNDADVTPIAQRRWSARDGSLVLVVSDPEAALGGFLVVRVRASAETPLRATLVRPAADASRVLSSTVETAPVGLDWTLIAVPRYDLLAAPAEEREARAGRSRLARIELQPVREGVRLDLNASLWAARPPVPNAEELP